MSAKHTPRSRQHSHKFYWQTEVTLFAREKQKRVSGMGQYVSSWNMQNMLGARRVCVHRLRANDEQAKVSEKTRKFVIIFSFSKGKTFLMRNVCVCASYRVVHFRTRCVWRWQHYLHDNRHCRQFYCHFYSIFSNNIDASFGVHGIWRRSQT